MPKRIERRVGRRGPVVLAFCALAAAACGDDDATPRMPDTGAPPEDLGSPPADSGAPDATADARGTDDAGPRDTGVAPDAGPPAPTIVVRGVIRDFLAGGPVEGLSVCIYELVDLPCATTAMDGSFSLPGVPAMDEVRLTYQNDADGWQRTMLHMRTGTVDMSWGLLVIDALVAEGLATDAGITVDPELATLVFTTTDGADPAKAVPTVSVSLDPDDAEAVAYLTDAFTVSTELTATSMQGLGFFANTPPGLHTLRFAHPDRDCINEAGWLGASVDETRVDVVGGWFVSAPSMVCRVGM